MGVRDSAGISSVLKACLKNPFTLYLRFLFNLISNKRRFQNFRQDYMASVTGCRCEPTVTIYNGADVRSCQIGSFTYIGPNATITLVQIGRFCSIGPNCQIGLGKHPTRQFVSTSPAFFSSARQCGTTFVNSNHFEENLPVIIGNDVWIGANVLIGGGIRIGNGAIIGAGAVVMSDVPDFAIYGGVPARFIRARFTPEQTAWLLQFEWWNRDEAWLISHAHLFSDISEMIAGCQAEQS